MLLAVAGIAGCGDSSPVDTGKLVTPTADQNAAIAGHDNSINDEEFRKPEAGSKIPRNTGRKRQPRPMIVASQAIRAGLG